LRRAVHAYLLAEISSLSSGAWLFAM